MKIKKRNGWRSFDKDFGKWYEFNNSPDWIRQKNWISKELVKRNLIKKSQLLNMWTAFSVLTRNCSSWNFQSEVLSFITLCMNEEIGEDLDLLV